jgi:hypothetical protein
LLLKKYRHFKRFIYVCCGISSILVIGTFFLFETKNIYYLLLGTSLIGFFMAPQTATFYEFACESVFPIGEGSAVAFL